MRALKRFFTRLLNSTLRRRDRERFREEIQSHLAMLTQENSRAGMAPEEARRQAHVKFGAVAAVCANCHDETGLPVVEDLLRDVRYTLRRLWKSPAKCPAYSSKRRSTPASNSGVKVLFMVAAMNRWS